MYLETWHTLCVVNFCPHGYLRTAYQSKLQGRLAAPLSHLQLHLEVYMADEWSLDRGKEIHLSAEVRNTFSIKFNGTGKRFYPVYATLSLSFDHGAPWAQLYGMTHSESKCSISYGHQLLWWIPKVYFKLWVAMIAVGPTWSFWFQSWDLTFHINKWCLWGSRH